MNRLHITATALLALSVASSAPTADGTATEWVLLFNGKNLSGWKANADPGAFTVKDGISPKSGAIALQAH